MTTGADWAELGVADEDGDIIGEDGDVIGDDIDVMGEAAVGEAGMGAALAAGEPAPGLGAVVPPHPASMISAPAAIRVVQPVLTFMVDLRVCRADVVGPAGHRGFEAADRSDGAHPGTGVGFGFGFDHARTTRGELNQPE